MTLGDPRGIGPEVARSAVEAWGATRGRVIFVGPDGMEVPGFDYHPVGAFDGSEASAGRVSADAIRAATHMALEGRVGAVVTAPVHKHALHAAGVAFPGHTEMLKALSGAREVGMLMAAERTRVGGALRVLLATTHLPLRDVPARLTSELLVGQARLLHAALARRWEIAEPRVALCAFNPHASDGGLFGDEEARIYGPALEALAEAGVGAVGPVPADTVFRRALDGEFDAVVAPYHDVGMAAFKTAAFGTGVNVTLGLPFVRTSPDHGTAFDIAGSGSADPTSMGEALRLASRLAALTPSASAP